MLSAGAAVVGPIAGSSALLLVVVDADAVSDVLLG